MRTPEFGDPLPRRRPRPPPGVAVPVLGARPRASDLPEHTPRPPLSRFQAGAWMLVQQSRSATGRTQRIKPASGLGGLQELGAAERGCSAPYWQTRFLARK